MIEMIIEPRVRDLGGFSVKRVLPYAKRKTVGPFIFVDQMGPAVFAPGSGIDVRPHPHIGLSTVTYLFEGRILHRDSLGYVQEIAPGAVNWMTAGRGIVHSERTTDADRTNGMKLYGIQTWIALPLEFETVEPSFSHHPEAELPTFDVNGVKVRLILGSAYGHTSPVQVFSKLFYLDLQVEAGQNFIWPKTPMESAIYLVEGELEIGGTRYSEGKMIIFKSNQDIPISCTQKARFLILGGESVGPREIYWNFVASSKEKIEAAKTLWSEDGFPKVPNETEFIPLPKD